MRVLSGICVVAVFVLMAGAGALAQGAGTAAVHRYDAYGFTVSIPAGAERIPMRDLGGGGMQEAYDSGGLGYVIIATSDVGARGMSARAALAMQMQVMDMIGPKVPELHYHSLTATTSQGVQAKGYAITGSAGKAGGRVPTEIASRYGSDLAVGLIAVPIVDNPALIGAVVVIGPVGRASEVDSQLIQVAGTILIGKPTLARYGVGANGKNKTDVPLQPDIKPMSELKKGQIELVGVVKSTDAVGKCVDMLVGQAVPFGGHGAIIDPPRLKRVYVKEIAEGVKEGVVIIVVAKDTGPGKSVTADTLTVMDMSKLGL